mmetsp:Transcript_23067/g.38484  ORF Transcript_23067/g.38484 Transcript_23067/m.38484 type:complete len:365 (-) Transcript_23067:185-1279(-)
MSDSFWQSSGFQRGLIIGLLVGLLLSAILLMLSDVLAIADTYTPSRISIPRYVKSGIPIEYSDGINIVVLVHTTRKNYHRRLPILKRTWMSVVPDWARVEFYTTPSDGLSLINHERETDQHMLHHGSDVLLDSIQYVMNKYPQTNYVYKVNDDTFVNWKGLKYVMKKHNMIHSNLFVHGANTRGTWGSVYRPNIYLGFCGCRLLGNRCGHLPARVIASTNWTEAFTKSIAQSEFTYVCGGSGMVLSRDSIAALAEYEHRFGCTRGTEEAFNLGFCLFQARNQTCIHDKMGFQSSLGYQAEWLQTRSVANDRRVRRQVAGIELHYESGEEAYSIQMRAWWERIQNKGFNYITILELLYDMTDAFG